MIRFDGNSILIIDGDKAYCAQLCEVLKIMGAQCFHAPDICSSKILFKKYEFDLVICNYYLADGIIHQLIDWCGTNLSILPVFTCLGYPMPSDNLLFHKMAIAEVFSKGDQKMLSRLSNLLFDFNQFHESLLEMITPSEIVVRASVGSKTVEVKPIEVFDEKVFLQSEQKFTQGTHGVLKFSLCFDNQTHSFMIPGFFEGSSSEGVHFRVTANYLSNWQEFLHYLNKKQLNITQFMNKAAGF